jgi:hypothetical protein
MTLQNLKMPAGFNRGKALSGVFVAILLGLWTISGPISHANAAATICTEVLQPFGHPGDRCWGPSRDLRGAGMNTYERAGCLVIANGQNELLESWHCTGSKSKIEIIGIPNDGMNRKGIMRNNNLTYAAYFAGSEYCWFNC